MQDGRIAELQEGKAGKDLRAVALAVLADSRRRAALGKDRAQLAAFVDQRWALRCVAHLPVVADLKPELALVGFFEDDAETCGEFCVGSSAT